MAKFIECPFCHQQVLQGNGSHMKKCRKEYTKTINPDEWKYLYLEEGYSIKDMEERFKVPSTWVRLILTELNIPQRSIRAASLCKRKKDKAEQTNIKRYGSKHNFCKKHPSRKKWEARLLEEEGITNVFQRKEVVDKIRRTKIEKYGDDWKWQHAKVNFLEHYIEKYGEEEGIKRYNHVCYNKGKTMRRSHYIELYGEEEGIKRYNQMISSRKFPSHWDGLNNKCANILQELNVEYEREFYLPSDDHAYHYDIKIGNLIIELNGTYWHCDPHKYKRNDIVNFPHVKKILVKDKWEYDKIKIEWAKHEGYDVEVIWEQDLNKELIKRILNKHNISYATNS